MRYNPASNMNNLHVNRNILDAVLSQLAGGADIDEDVERFGDINPNDKKQIKEIIALEILPDFQKSSTGYKNLLKQTLSYYLTTGSLDFERLFNLLLIAFDPPTPAVEFFIWLWEELFPNENYNLKNWQEFVEGDDLKEVKEMMNNSL